MDLIGAIKSGGQLKGVIREKNIFLVKITFTSDRATIEVLLIHCIMFV